MQVLTAKEEDRAEGQLAFAFQVQLALLAASSHMVRTAWCSWQRP